MKRKQIYALLMVMSLSVFSPSYTVFAETNSGYMADVNAGEKETKPDIKRLTGYYGRKLSDVSLPDGYEWVDPDVVLDKMGQQKYEAYDNTETSGTNKKVKELDVYVIPTGLEGTYNQKISEVELPDGFAWKNKNDRLSHVGERSYKAIYTPEDTENYDPIEVEITVNIKKANVPEKEYKEKIPSGLFRFPGESLYSISLPAGFQWQDADVTFKELGKYKYKVSYTPLDDENYNVVKDIEVEVEVTKDAKDPDVTIPSGLTAVYEDTLAKVILPDGFTWTNPDQKLEKIGKQEFQALYVPKDTKHYKTKMFNIMVDVQKKKMTVTYPDKEYKITYGDTFGKISLPEFWSMERASEKPNAGSYKIKATLSADQEHYEISNYNGDEAEITVTVAKAIPGYTVPPAINVKSGTKLTDNMLPTVSIGTYQWDDESSPKSSGTYYCSFYPADTDNYKVVKHIGVRVIVKQEATNVKPDDGKTDDGKKDDTNKGDSGNNSGGNNTGSNTGNNNGNNNGNNGGNHSGNSGNETGSSGNKSDSNKNNTGSNNNTTVIKPTPVESGKFTSGTNYGSGGNESGNSVKNIKSDSITVTDASTVTKKTPTQSKTKLVRPTTTNSVDATTKESTTTGDNADSDSTTTTATTETETNTEESSVPENDITKNEAEPLSETDDQDTDETDSSDSGVIVTEDEEKKGNGAIIALICVILGAIGGGGFYYYKKNYKSGDKDDIEGV